jgi:hypothetical protein
MKKILVLLLVLPLISFAQQIPKDAKTIIVKNVSFLEVCNALLDHGYTIATKDNDLQTAKTEEREYPDYWTAKYVVHLRVKDSTAYLSGTFTAAGLFKNEPVYCVTDKKGEPKIKNLMTYPFLLINDVALSLKKPVEYK